MAVGTEYWFTPKFVVGAEFHLALKDNNLGVFIEFKL